MIILSRKKRLFEKALDMGVDTGPIFSAGFGDKGGAVAILKNIVGAEVDVDKFELGDALKERGNIGKDIFINISRYVSKDFTEKLGNIVQGIER